MDQNKHVIAFKKFNQARSSTKYMFIWMHDLSYLPHCIIASMHQFMLISYACPWQTKKILKRNPNLACGEQTNKQTEKQSLKKHNIR